MDKWMDACVAADLVNNFGNISSKHTPSKYYNEENYAAMLLPVVCAPVCKLTKIGP